MFHKSLITFHWIPYFYDSCLWIESYADIEMNKINLLIMRIKLLAFLLIIFCCCSRKSINEKDNIDSILEIDLLSESVSKVKNLSKFAANIDYIPLQTLESSLIGGFISKIVNMDKRIYITNMENIMCFDIDGKFLSKIEKIGRGPEEYTSIEDFDVSSDNKSLTMLSLKKIFVYDISDTGFTFQRSLALKDPAPARISMVPETDNVFLAIPPWRGTEPTLSLLINNVGDTIHFKPNCYKYEMVRKSNYRAGNETIVYSIGNKVCFKEGFSDTVFYISLKNNFFKPRIILSSHGTLITPEVRGGSETSGNHTNFIANIFETSRYVFYYYGTPETRNRIIFDKATNEKFKLDIDSELKSELKDDLCGGPDFSIEFTNSYCSGSKLFSFIDPITLKKYIAGEDFKSARVSDPVEKVKLKKLADSLKETDNPVLIVVTPKE